jgi:hypothetical protein
VERTQFRFVALAKINTCCRGEERNPEKERNSILKSELLALILLATGAVFAQVSIGIRIGPPPPVRVMRIHPASPGPEYVWIGGYWYPNGNRYRWHEGYWTRPAYRGARWVEPHHDGERYFQGYWEGGRGRVEHDHRWDRDHDRKRDFDRRHGDDHDRDDHDRH